MATVMWEVRAVEGRQDDLLAWVLDRVPAGAQVYRSSDGEPRLVVIDPSGTAAESLAGAPDELAARPAHAWSFDRV